MKGAPVAVLIVGLVLGACAGGSEIAPASGATTSRVGATSDQAQEPPPVFEVTLDVAYREELRVPGTGHVLRELTLTYTTSYAAALGEVIDAAPVGTAVWTVRCYVDQFAPGQSAAVEYSGEHPAVFAWLRDDVRRHASLEAPVDWTSGPASALVADGDDVQIVHRLPSALALDDSIGCEGEEAYAAIALAAGNAAMTAPGRVSIAGEERSTAEALNEASGDVRYLVDDGRSGWLVEELTIGDIGETATEFSMQYEVGPDPEGGQVLTIAGSIRSLG